MMTDDPSKPPVSPSEPPAPSAEALPETPLTAELESGIESGIPDDLPSKPVALENEPFPELHVGLEVICGVPISAERIPAILRLYQALALQPDQPLWVLEAPDGTVAALKSPLTGKAVHHPLEAGYRNVGLPAPLAAALQSVGKIVAALPGIRILEDTLILPNGARRSLTPTRWQSPEGKAATLYRVKRLPDLRWLRISDVKTCGHYDFEDKKSLKGAIDHEIAGLEATGYSRTPSPALSVQAALPPKPPSPDGLVSTGNPFSVSA